MAIQWPEIVVNTNSEHLLDFPENFRINFQIFLVWLKDFVISDRKFELYVKNCVYSQLERS